MSGELIAIVVLGVALALLLFAIALRTRRRVSTPEEQAVHATLRTAAAAARPLRDGLTADSAAEAVGPLRALTSAEGLAIFDGDGRLLAEDGADNMWIGPVRAAARQLAGDALEVRRHPCRAEVQGVSIARQ